MRTNANLTKLIVRKYHKKDRNIFYQLDKELKFYDIVYYGYRYSSRLSPKQRLHIIEESYERLKLFKKTVPILYKNSTLLHFPEKFNQIDKNLSLFISGNIGVGKTYLMYALIRKEIISRNLNVEIHNWIDLQYLIRSTYNTQILSINQCIDLYGIEKGKKKYFESINNTETQIIKKLKECDILVLDDIGVSESTNNSKEWSKTLLYMLINYRYSECKKTIITSNFSLDSISEKISERIFSRINHNFKWIELTGEDRRTEWGGES